MCSKRFILLSAAAITLGACSTVDRPNDSIERSIGEAIAWNKAVQTVNPEGAAAGPGSAQPGGNGAVAAEAHERYYRTDKVKPVERIGTSTSSLGGGSGPQ